MNLERNSLIEEFIAIIGEKIPHSQINLYLENARGNLELALNMYFRAKEKKDKLKNMIDLDNNKRQSQSTKDFHTKERYLFYQKTGRDIPDELRIEHEQVNTRENKELELSSDPVNAFSLLKRGSIESKKVEIAIKELKTDYEKGLNLARLIETPKKLKNEENILMNDNYTDRNLSEDRKENTFQRISHSLEVEEEKPQTKILGNKNQGNNSNTETKRIYKNMIEQHDQILSEKFPLPIGKMSIEAHINRMSIKSTLHLGDQIYLKRVSKAIELPTKGKKKVKSKPNDHLINVIYTKNDSHVSIHIHIGRDRKT